MQIHVLGSNEDKRLHIRQLSPCIGLFVFNCGLKHVAPKLKQFGVR